MISNQNPLQPPIDSYSKKPISTKKNKKISSKLSSLAPSFPSPDREIQKVKSIQTKASVKNPKKTKIDLQDQKSKIESEFQKLEELQKNPEGPKALQEILSWGSEAIDFTNEYVVEGVKFLNEAIQSEFLGLIPSSKKEEFIAETLSTGSVLLTAIGSGLNGLALICKSNILEKSKTLLSELKKTQEEVGLNTKNPEKSLNEKERVKKTILEWEAQIEVQEKALLEEKFKFNLQTTSNVLSLLAMPFSYTPASFKHVGEMITKGLSAIGSAVSIVIKGIQLKNTVAETAELKGWIASYQARQDQHQPQVKVTKSMEEQEHAFFEWINKTENFHDVKEKLKDFNIPLHPSISSKKTLIKYLKTHSHYKQKLLKKYITFQNQFDRSLHTVFVKTETLLAKRKERREQNISSLTTQFQTIKDKIYNLKKTVFIREMQQLLGETLQKPQCSSQEVQEQFEKWGLLDPAMKQQNAALLKSLHSFKNASEGTIEIQKKRLVKELTTWINDSTVSDKQLSHWFRIQPKRDLIEFYVDHQETIEQTTKNALKQMIQQKHTQESQFQTLKLKGSLTEFNVALIGLGISTALAIMGLISIPFGGAGVILLILSIGSIALSMGLLGASLIQFYHYKPQTFKTMTVLFLLNMTWTKLRTSIQVYLHQAKQDKFFETVRILTKLQLSIQSENKKDLQAAKLEFQKALEDFKKTKAAFTKSENKVHDWTEKLKRLEKRLAKEGWKDFVQYSSLEKGENGAFDTLRAFQEALKACDLRLLSEETKSFLEVYLGMNIEALQAEMKKEPKAIQNTLREFFVLDNAGLINFIKTQKIRHEKGLLKPQIAF